MIQRIQSLYLLLTAILSFLFLDGSFIRLTDKSGSVIGVTFSQIMRDTPDAGQQLLEKSYLLAAYTIMIPVLAGIIIILFKKRNIQLWLVRLLIVLILSFILVSVLNVISLARKYDSSILPGVKMAIPFLQLILSYLALRGIKKDDNLIKSYDRLR
jgi:hypothetical protein